MSLGIVMTYPLGMTGSVWDSWGLAVTSCSTLTSMKRLKRSRSSKYAVRSKQISSKKTKRKTPVFSRQISRLK